MTLKQPIAGSFSNPDHAEACELVGKCRFSEQRGDAREGSRLSIFVDSRPNAARRSLRVLVVFHVFGHRRVNWSGCIIAVRKEASGERPAAFAFLHPGGEAVFEGLPFGTYRLFLQPYGRDIWINAWHLPAPEQIEQQDWLPPEGVCRGLADRVVQTVEPKTAGAEAVAILGAFTGRSEEMARPALSACLGLLCNASLPESLRTSASKFITPKKAAFLSDANLSTFSSALHPFSLPSRSLPSPGPLEIKLYKTFGTVLSQRPSIGKDEKELLEKLVIFSQHFSQPRQEPPRPVAVPTRRGVRTRGRGRAAPKFKEGLLVVLARSGGIPVRKALVEILKTLPDSDRLLASFLKSTP